jgi:P-type Cu+ transporter
MESPLDNAAPLDDSYIETLLLGMVRSERGAPFRNSDCPRHRKGDCVQHDERTTILVIGGMDGAESVAKVEAALHAFPGVETVGVNLLTRLATVRHAHTLSERELVEAVDAAGFQASMASPTGAPRVHVSFGDTIDVIATRRSRFIAGAILTFLILLVQQFWGSNDSNKLLLLFLLATPVQITVGWDFYRGCIHALRRWTFNLDSLVVLGSTAAYLQGFMCFIGQASNDTELMYETPLFYAAALILTVVSLGKWLESHARDSMQQLWGSLAEMAPKSAAVIRDGREQIIPSGVVAVGDIVVVRPFEKIPVDGEIIEGATEVNEGLFTGDAALVPREVGDRVVAASINGSGLIHLRARGVGVDSTISLIARRVHDAQSMKASIELLCDRISATLVPVTVAIATAAFAMWYFGPVAVQKLVNGGTLSRAWLENSAWFSFLLQEWSLSAALKPAIAVLVVACPCAVGLATPTAVIVAMGLGARRGILINGGAAIEAAARVRHVVFGKNSTLHDGTYNVMDVLPVKGLDAAALVALAGALEAGSEHAMARGVLREARRRGIELPAVQDFKELPGRGLEGRVGGRRTWLGSPVLMAKMSSAIPDDLLKVARETEASGASVVFLADDERGVLGALVLQARIKEHAASAIAALKEQGFAVHLLSGGSVPATEAVAQRVGLDADSVHAELDADQKTLYVRKLKNAGAGVAAVGDGIDDAPLLAAADVGMALGVGADVANELGQVVLVSPDARGVGRALRLMRQAARTIRWNLLWAFAFNIVMIPLAFFDKLEPVVAVSAMTASSILVVLNSLRLIYKPHDDPQPPQAQPETVQKPAVTG